MNDLIGFAGVGSAIIASMGLAMWLEWFCLSWLMRVMPGRVRNPSASAAVMSTVQEIEAETVGAVEPKQVVVELPATAATKSTRREIRLGT